MKALGDELEARLNAKGFFMIGVADPEADGQISVVK